VPVGERDHGGVAVAVAVAFGRLHQPLDFGLGQMLPFTVIGIGPSASESRSLLAGLTAAVFALFERGTHAAANTGDAGLACATILR
jgi:hypothetical protein